MQGHPASNAWHQGWHWGTVLHWEKVSTGFGKHTAQLVRQGGITCGRQWLLTRTLHFNGGCLLFTATICRWHLRGVRVGSSTQAYLILEHKSDTKHSKFPSNKDCRRGVPTQTCELDDGTGWTVLNGHFFQVKRCPLQAVSYVWTRYDLRSIERSPRKGVQNAVGETEREDKSECSCSDTHEKEHLFIKALTEEEPASSAN